MSADLDVTQYADDIAAMQAEHEAYAVGLLAYRKELVRALGLLDAAEKLRALRVEQLTARQERLANAIGASIDALDAVEAAGRTVVEACRLVASVRESRP